ncbi:hypothetical protein HMPREF9566_02188 [Cutibacterium acnes HL045PA1]|nr:hypothetical protein HMPREF9566_02188 [Cutibacterium acnes HL045PA1]
MPCDRADLDRVVGTKDISNHPWCERQVLTYDVGETMCEAVAWAT